MIEVVKMSFSTLFLFPFALMKTLIEFVLFIFGMPFTLGRDPFVPHPWAGFEGFYSRTQLDDGGTLALIFCWVRGARQRRNLVCVAYAPLDTSELPAFKYEFYPDDLDAESNKQHASSRLTPFVLNAAGVGTMSVSPTRTDYTIRVPHAQLQLDLRLTSHTPWSEARLAEGPMGPLVHLSRFLPVNWHVFSTASHAEYTITHAGRTRQGSGVAHLEKNWGNSFPKGWIWSQSFRPHGGSFCLAGGDALLGIQAYLLGYRSARFKWDFRPPFTIAIGRFSPFLRIQHDSRSGRVDLEIKTWFRKLVVELEAPPGSFIGLPAPLPDGHRPDFAFESFQASNWIELWVRHWPWGDWTMVEASRGISATDDVACAALEFGGAFSHDVQARDGSS